jgi:hypothetical protein
MTANNLASSQVISKIILLTGIIFVFIWGATAARYRAHDRIGLVANTVGPFNNPTETYPVFLTSSQKYN